MQLWLRFPFFTFGSVWREGTSLGFFSLNFVILKIVILEKNKKLVKFTLGKKAPKKSPKIFRKKKTLKKFQLTSHLLRI
jgi:hypothetical protein